MLKKILLQLLFIALSASLFSDSTEQDRINEEESEKLTTYDQGFWLYSPNKGNKSLRIGGYIQVDGRFFLQPDNFLSEFLVRRARIYATGQITDLWGYMLMARWDREQAGLHFAWIDTLLPKSARLRFGLFKVPFGLEALYSNLFWDLDERSLGTQNYLNLQNIGVMFFGKTNDDHFEYALGLFNGHRDQFERNAGKELAGRIVIAPFLGSKGLFDRLYFGFSGMYSRTNRELSGQAFRTQAWTEFWVWAGDDDNDDGEDHTVIAKGGQTKWGADFEWLYGSGALRAECLKIHASKVSYLDVTLPFHGHSWYVESSYIITGEEAPRNGPVVPRKDFVFCEGGGAIQLAARYEQFLAPKKMIKAGFATGTYRASAVTLGVNWFFNREIALKVNWEYLKFANDIKINNRFEDFESVITARIQAEF